MTNRFRHLWTEADQPSPDLIEIVAPWIVDASRPFADWYFGAPEVAADILHEWMSRPTAEVFVGRGILAEDEQATAIGCLIGITGDELARCRAADFAAFCGELGDAPEADEVVADVVTASHELFPPVAADELYISRVAVDPARRGQGFGRALVVHAMETFGEQGQRQFRLDVSADNEAAIRAYQAAGLDVVATSRSELAGLTYCAMAAAL